MIIGNQSFLFVRGIALNFGNTSRKIDGLILIELNKSCLLAVTDTITE